MERSGAPRDIDIIGILISYDVIDGEKTRRTYK